VRHRQRRFRRDCDHVLSKQIVQSVEPGGTIVLENLKDIRKRMKAKRRTKTKRRMHSWSFAQLKGFIAYKAEERGCTVAGIDPGIPRRRVAAAGMLLVPTAAPKAYSFVGSVGITSMPT
jgi:IS605 OrfB family transposase